MTRPQGETARERSEVLNYIYARAGRVTANRGQQHLRDFEEEHAV